MRKEAYAELDRMLDAEAREIRRMLRTKRGPEFRSRALDIVPPSIVWPVADRLLRVRMRSPLQWRRAVWKIAQYFKREGHFDFCQYGEDGRDDDPRAEAYLFPAPRYHGLEVPCIGATCFRWRETGWGMQWVWIHPYFRRQGVLSDVWPVFRERYGEFELEGPLSPAMFEFAKKQGIIL